DVGRKLSAFACGSEDTVAKGLGKNQLVSSLRAGIGEKKVGMRFARDGETILKLCVYDCMSPDNERIGLMYFFLPPSKYAAQNLQRQIVRRKRDDIERSDGLTAHRIHVGERIRGCDLPEVEWIV